MKIRLITILLFVCFSIFGQLYYMSHKNVAMQSRQAENTVADWYISPNGDNTNGLTPTTAYNSFADLIASETIIAGDIIAFERGETFNETITLSSSGTSGNPIFITSYGSGNKPIISGFTEITSGWTDEGGGIYSKSITADSKTMMVTVDGENTPVGRYPNSGWLSYESYSSNTSITDNGLGDATNWTGADLVLRKNRWTCVRGIITNHSGDVITYSNSDGQNGTNGFGYFICDDLRTLDSYGEWFHDTGTNTFYMYFGGVNPSTKTVKVATKNYLVDLYTNQGLDYITFDNLQFEGAIKDAVYAYGYICDNLIFTNNIFQFNGHRGIYLEGCINSSIQGNIFTESSTGIRINEGGNMLVSGNTFSNIGLISGASDLVGDNSYQAIRFHQGTLGWQPQYSFILNNKIQNTGWNGINFRGLSINVKYNYIDSICKILDDGAGIYTSQSISNGSEITKNVVLNSVGASSGTSGSSLSGNGIYLDETTVYVLADSNTVAHCSLDGIKIHKSKQNTLRHNTIFDCANGIGFENWDGISRLTDDTVEYNLIVAKESSQNCLEVETDYSEGPPIFGPSDYNIYSRPTGTDSHIHYNLSGVSNNYYTVFGFNAFNGTDLNSSDPNYSVTTSDSIYFEYNGTSSGVAGQHHDFQVKDFKGNIYPAGNFWLPAYSSIIYVPNY